MLFALRLTCLNFCDFQYPLLPQSMIRGIMSSPSSQPSTARSSTPTAIRQSDPCVCTLSEIITQLFDKDDKVKFRCLAYKIDEPSSNSVRCLESSQNFEASHDVLYNRAVKFLSKETVTPFEYSSFVIRIFFCEDHQKSKIFKTYYDKIEASWKEGGTREKRELLNSIRRVCRFQVSSDQAPEEYTTGLLSLPHRNRLETEPTLTTSRPQLLPMFQYHATPQKTLKASDHFHSAPRISTMATISPPSSALKPCTLFPCSVQTRPTRSRSNPFYDINITQHTQNSSNELLGDLHQNTSCPKTSPSVGTLLLQSQVSEHSRAFLGVRSSHQVSLRDIPTHGTFNRGAGEQEDVPQGPFDFGQPQVAATRLCLKDNLISTETKTRSTPFSFPPKTSFDYICSMPKVQSSISSEFTPTPNGSRDAPVSVFDTFDTIKPQRPSPNGLPNIASKPVISRFNAPMSALNPINGSFVRHEEDPTMEAGVSTSVFSSTSWNDLVNLSTLLQPVGKKEARRHQSSPSQRQSKDDTYLDQAARAVGRPPLLSHANTDSQILVHDSAGKFSQTVPPLQIDIGIRAEIKKEVNEGGYVYILRAPKYSQDHFPDKPTMLKIGKATDILTRMQDIRTKCKQPDLTRVEDPEDRPLRLYWKIENLVHAELQNFKRVFECQECGKRHNEWFAVTEEVALNTVQRWRKFIQQNPYDENGILKDHWSQKIRDGYLPPREKHEKWYDCKDRNERWTKWLDEGVSESNNT